MLIANYPDPKDPSHSYESAIVTPNYFRNTTDVRSLTVAFQVYASADAFYAGCEPIDVREVTVSAEDYLAKIAANADLFNQLGDLLDATGKELIPEFATATAVPTTIPTTLDPRQPPEQGESH